MKSELLSISVPGLPPKKDGANSMWRKPAEIPRLIALRRAAHTTMAGRPLFSEPLEIRIRIHADPADGDLDNFITGIFDGLQAAHIRTPIDPEAWEALPPAARPREHLVYSDDRWISRVTAERLSVETGGKRYTVDIIVIGF